MRRTRIRTTSHHCIGLRSTTKPRHARTSSSRERKSTPSAERCRPLPFIGPRATALPASWTSSSSTGRTHVSSTCRATAPCTPSPTRPIIGRYCICSADRRWPSTSRTAQDTHRCIGPRISATKSRSGSSSSWVRTRTPWIMKAAPHCTGRRSLGTRGASSSSSRRARTSTRRTGIYTPPRTWRPNFDTLMPGMRHSINWESRPMDQGSANRSAKYVAVLCPIGPAAVRKRLTRPQPSVNIITFSVPTVALGIAFMIAGVFPWYMSVILSPAAFFVICKVEIPTPFAVLDTLLTRRRIIGGDGRRAQKEFRRKQLGRESLFPWPYIWICIVGSVCLDHPASRWYASFPIPLLCAIIDLIHTPDQVLTAIHPCTLHFYSRSSFSCSRSAVHRSMILERALCPRRMI